MFDGAELNGMKLEVREERFAAPTTGPFGGGGRGAFGAPRGGYAPRGRGAYGGPSFHQNVQPSNQIFVKNVRIFLRTAVAV